MPATVRYPSLSGWVPESRRTHDTRSGIAPLSPYRRPSKDVTTHTPRRGASSGVVGPFGRGSVAGETQEARPEPETILGGYGLPPAWG